MLPFHICPPQAGKEDKEGLLFLDVNITTKKVNDKNPLEMLKYPIKKACPLFQEQT